jgi:hypothetical protein
MTTGRISADGALLPEFRRAWRADPRTTRLYDCRQKKIARNIAERISI